jgi:hypothetical protein
MILDIKYSAPNKRKLYTLHEIVPQEVLEGFNFSLEAFENLDKQITELANQKKHLFKK